MRIVLCRRRATDCHVAALLAMTCKTCCVSACASTSYQTTCQPSAHSPKALLFATLHCKGYGLSRRCAPGNDMQKLAACQRVQAHLHVLTNALCLPQLAAPLWVRYRSAYRPPFCSSWAWVPSSWMRPSAIETIRVAERMVESRWAIISVVRPLDRLSNAR